MRTKKLYYLAGLIIFLLAFFVRFYQLGQVPVSLYWDETAILIDAKTIAQNGMDMHGNGWLRTMFPSYGDYKLPVYIWFAAISVKLLGISEFALRLPSALAGMGSVIVAGLLGYEMMLLAGKGNLKKTAAQNFALLTGFSASAVMAITPWSILFSRTGFEGHLAQFLAAAAIYITLKSVNRKWLLIIAVLLGGLATYTYFSVRFVWPPVFTYFWLLANQDSLLAFNNVHSWLKKNWLTVVALLLSLLGYLATLQPMFNSPLYEASNQFRLSTTSVLNSHDYAVESNILREQAGNSFIDRIIFHRHWLMIRELLKNYADNLSPSYLFVTGDQNLRHGTGSHGVLLLPTLPLLLLGIYQLSKKNWLVLLGLISWWIVALLPASIPETTPHALRSLNALMPIVILMGMGTALLITWFKTQLTKKTTFDRILGLTTATFFGLSLTFASSGFLFHYFTLYPNQSAYDWQDGYRQLTSVVLEQQSAVRTIWIDPSEDRFYLWLLAYGPYTAEQIQAIPKTGYKVTAVDNILFKGFEWEKLSSLDHKALVVGQPHDIENRVGSQSILPSTSIKVSGNDNQTERFRAVLYQPNL